MLQEIQFFGLLSKYSCSGLSLLYAYRSQKDK